MLRRRLPAALLLAVACAAALAIGLRDERSPRPGGSGAGSGALSAAEAMLLRRTGGGPAGSRVVALSRWRYRDDRADRGRDRGWGRGDFGGRAVGAPYSPNAREVRGAAGRRAYDGSVGWFATRVDAPLAGLDAIRFDSVHHSATVFVDGAAVRRHVGAYEPFTARVRLDRGHHTVAVRVDWRAPRRQADGGWARSWFNYGGLNRPVTLMRLGASELGALTVRT